MTTRAKIDRLQDITVRLKSGKPQVIKRVERDNGHITGIIEEQNPFEPDKLLPEGERLCAELNRADLEGEERIIYAGAVADFCGAAIPYAAPQSRSGLERTRRETLDRLYEAGVKL